MAIAMGKALGLSCSQLDSLSLTAALHDIGKITIAEDILMKPGALTPGEWAIVKQHSELGADMTNTIPELSSLSEAIQGHHEHWDGTGYPQGLKGTDIPLPSRIIAIIDAYDVMTHGRPYKKAMSQEAAIKELQNGAGNQFDPHLVKLFIQLIEDGKVVSIT
jgi:HD-GYP domain-containing protein (c-di-GMP phosphodiesterase class II)